MPVMLKNLVYKKKELISNTIQTLCMHNYIYTAVYSHTCRNVSVSTLKWVSHFMLCSTSLVHISLIMFL